MRIAAIHSIRNVAQLWILSVAVLCAGHAYALDSTPARGDADGVQKTKPFGKLSLSLSLTLSAPVSEPKPQASTVKASDAQPGESSTKAKTLSELNAEIASIEEMISARQRQLDIVPAGPTPPSEASLQPSPQPSQSSSPELATSVDTVSVESAQDAAIVGEPGVASVESGTGNENFQPNIVAPTVRPASMEKNRPVELPGMTGMDWAIALVVPLLAASGLVWYRRRKITHIGKPDKYQGASEMHEEPMSAQPPDRSVAPSAAVEQAMKMPAEAEQPQKQQSILPPEYEMLEEADIYLRFGHDKLAEEALREAIKINPKNPQAYLTLLRIFFSREDSVAFLAVAQQLKSLGDGSVWQRVAEMGRNLDPDNPLYR